MRPRPSRPAVSASPGYRDSTRPAAARVADLVARMSLEEKLAQLVGLWLWVDPDTGRAAPYRGPFGDAPAGDADLDERIRHGLGQVTRLFGSRPVEPVIGARAVNDLQRRLVEGTRLGIPAIVHEECLTGLMAHGATAFPSPLNYGATWDVELIEQVGTAIRTQMRAVGAHQGLAPVLDVVRDARWGRVEECLGEDPYLVGCMGSAYVRGLQGPALERGAAATVKHFAGHSFSEGGRNLAPAHLGPRELADVFLVPFEMAVRDGGARSVMNAYQEIDGVPAAASVELLTGVLREQWDFDGIVVSDYSSISHLHALHRVSEGPAESARLALEAGIDVELPNPDCYAEPLGAAVRDGAVDAGLVDRAVARVLALKIALGLFEQPYVPLPDGEGESIDLDPPAHRALARTVADRSIVLLENAGGLLPLDPSIRAVALIGPNADHGAALLGNYAFENHVAAHFDEAPSGAAVITVAGGLRSALGEGARVSCVTGCDVTGTDTSGFAEAEAVARSADVAIVVVGDRAGHFGTGTVGEGTDVDDLALPGVQHQLVEAVVATGTPTIVVLVAGRPYDLSWIARHVPAVVAAWFPGEEGGNAIAGVLTGAVNPSAKTPLTFGRGAGQQPLTYLHTWLGRTGYSRSSTRPVFAFGHGLSYSAFEYSELTVTPDVAPTDGSIPVVIACTVRNAGARAGDEVVQLYVHDVVASVTRPVLELKGFCRVGLEPDQAERITFTVPPDLLSFTGRDGARVVEPGAFDVAVGSSSADLRLRGQFRLTGTTRAVGRDRHRSSTVGHTALVGPAG